MTDAGTVCSAWLPSRRRTNGGLLRQEVVPIRESVMVWETVGGQ